MISSILLLSVLGSIHGGLSNPIGMPPPVGCKADYKVLSHKEVIQPPVLVSGRAIKGCSSGCELSKEDSVSIGVEVTVGAELGLNYQAASAGIGVSVTYSETKAEAWGQTQGCPDGAICKLTIRHYMMEVSGQQSRHVPSDFGCTIKSGPYTMLLPQTVKTDGGDSAKVEYAACFAEGTKMQPYPDNDYKLCPDYPNWGPSQLGFDLVQFAGRQQKKKKKNQGGS